MTIPTPAPNPCSLLHQLPRGQSENLSPTQTYRLAHSVECRLMLNAERTDRNLRFILGHAFTLDKIKLRIIAIEEEEQKAQVARAARAARAATKSNPSGRVSFHDSGRGKLRNEIRSSSPAGSPARRRTSPPPPTGALYNSDSETSSDDEEDEGLVLALTSSNRSNAGTKIPDLALSSEDDSSSEDEEDEEPIHRRLSDSVLETIIEEPGDETLAELYETVAGCPCHGKESPVIEQIWEIPPAILEEEQKKYEEREGLNKPSNDKKRLGRPMGAGRRIGVVRVAA